jgi:gliding motility-associated-like protein
MGMRRFALVLLFCGWTCQLFAVDYFVGGANASDNNAGTATQPFATIQKAASVAKNGDVVKIRSGTYRESITPANSGVTFQNDNGANVVVSGLNTVTGNWTVHNGNIYKISINLPAANNFNERTNGSNTVILANQIFQNGEMQHLARWPKANTMDDLFDRTKFRPRTSTAAFGLTSLTDAGIPQNLTGGWISMSGWILTQTRQIKSQSGGTITYDPTVEYAGDQFRQFYYVCGALSLLTQAKEWHYQGGVLYLWQNGGGAPTNVEYKARNWGFDLRGKSNIIVSGLTFIGCDPVTTDFASPNITVDNIKASYMNHNFLQMLPGANYFLSAKQVGLKLLGPGSVLKNSELAYGGAHGVWLGSNTRAENNLIHHIAYDGMWGAAVMPWEGNTGGQVITKNTMHTLGRSGINVADNVGSHLNMDISYNDVYNHTRLNLDNGAIYGGMMVDLTGTRIHHNWFHDIGVQSIGPLMGVQVTGVYVDQACGPVTLDHNVQWGNSTSIAGADWYAEIKNEHRNTGGHKLYNNTFWSNPVYSTYITWVTTPNDVQRNNIYRHNVNVAQGASPGNIANVLLTGVDPQFLGTGGGGLNFRLKPTSPAVNTGIAIPGITDGSVGTPDIGAYELNGEAWVAGYKAVTQAVTPNNAPTGAITSPVANQSFTVGSTVNITATASDNDGTVTKVEFFDGATKIGEDLTSPYAFAWANPSAGSHTLTAKVTDNDKATGTSAAVSITIAASAIANKNPSGGITSPANNATSKQGAAVNITATATDSDGTVVKVEFFDGAAKLGEDTSNPYAYSWTSPAVGAHAITAKITDDKGGITVSAVVNITITPNTVVTPPPPVPVPGNVAPVVSINSPADWAPFNDGDDIALTATATDSDGTIKRVEFYSGTDKIGEDVTQPYQFTWEYALPGTYAITAVATDNSDGQTVSAVINIVVNEVGEEQPEQPVIPAETDLYAGIPRFFSPNGDGTGDTWAWSNNPRYAKASVTILNRAGEVVYQSSAYDNSWDGRSNGKALQDGDYYYVVRLADLTELRASVRIVR